MHTGLTAGIPAKAIVRWQHELPCDRDLNAYLAKCQVAFTQRDFSIMGGILINLESPTGSSAVDLLISGIWIVGNVAGDLDVRTNGDLFRQNRLIYARNWSPRWWPLRVFTDPAQAEQYLNQLTKAKG
jgi:hypothetical protein